jgi:osmotically-inducible protein OsmY
MDHVIRFESEQLLAKLVREAFRQNSYRQLRQMDCRSIGTTVVLRGTADSFYIKQIAQYTASKVDGVQRVVNEIEVLTG